MKVQKSDAVYEKCLSQNTSEYFKSTLAYFSIILQKFQSSLRINMDGKSPDKLN
jgi:hypothetical protein